MALGEEKAEVEASMDGKAQPCGTWSCGEPASGEQPPRLEAEGGPASPVWGAEQPAPTCWAESEPGGSQPTPDREPPAVARTGDFRCSVGSQLEDSSLPASVEPHPMLTVPRPAASCSGHDADTEDDLAPGDSPQVLDLSPQPRSSGFSLPSRWKSRAGPGAAGPQLSSRTISSSSPASSVQSCQEKADPQSCPRAEVCPSSVELIVPPSPRSPVEPGPRLPWSPPPVSSERGAAGPSRRHLSFQAEYWACVLPDSLPPSPDRHSPFWNPNKEYEDLLDYTYPLRPGRLPPKHLESRVLTDPVLQDSGVDLDSFTVSPASTLKSPTNVAHSCPTAEATVQLCPEPGEPSLKCWPPGGSPKQGSTRLPSCQLASTPRVPSSRAALWQSREPSLRGSKVRLPVGTRQERGSPTLRTQGGGGPSCKPVREGHNAQRTPTVASGWKAEEVESEDEYLALPPRLSQASSLLSYVGSIPTLPPLPAGAAEGRSSLDVSDSDGLTSLPSHSSQSQRPSSNQSRCVLRSLARPPGSAGEGSLVSSQALGVPSGPLSAPPSCQAVLHQRVFSDLDADGQPHRRGEQGTESLVQCVKAFCLQLEELIHWLYNVADVSGHLLPRRSSLAGLKSSLQLYRQFKKDIDEHQFLTESVLEKGERLLQSLLENTPVLKDVLGRISEQTSDLESHADHVYDSILASLDMLAGCTLIPDSKPMRAQESPCEGL
ncbi:PREDICTED: centrosomal protein of 68 kDa [Elephantulus edwardii]|uniref:centrosomal protein of 68 kDa n=1 Tax=Elephantulus edwardii TaxID=28737 RepID=UPI0003F0AC05|nr:PREDICTED: centrosomal protein of 68 kDa [Elephantulus edwardii]